MFVYCVKVTPKKGAAKKLTAKITVKNPSVAFTDSVSEVAVGATETLTATSTPKAAVKFYSADKTIATVGKTTGVVTGVKEGTVKIAAKFYTGKKENKVYKEITVKKQIFKDVKQTKADTLEATIVGDTKDLKADSVAIKNTANNITYAVKSVTVDKTDATKVTIVTFAKMNDGKDYSVTIADTTKTITATDNKVVAVAVTPVTVPYATLSTISAIATDAQGVVLDEANFGSATLAGKTIDFTITPVAGGYTDGAQLYLAKKGDTATAKVTLKSGDYDNNGKEINNVESGDVTITAGDQEVVTVSGFKARVTKDANVTKYDDAKENNSLAVGDTAKLFLKFTNSKDKELSATEYAKYTVSSSNNNVLVMNEQAATAAAISVTGVASGSAYIIVKDEKSNVVATLPVTVNGARTVDSLTLSSTSVVLSTADAVGTETIKIAVKDQYKEALASPAYIATASILSAPAGALASGPSVSVANDQESVTFATKTSIATGTYKYKVTVKSSDEKVERSQVVTVDVKAPTGTAGYAFEISGLDANNTVDTTLNDKYTGPKAVTIKIVKTLGGVKADYATYSAISLKKDNKDVDNFSSTAGTDTATFDAIATDGAIATAAAAGTYVVNATVNGAKVAPVTFIVKNDTAKVTVEQVKNELKQSEATNLDDVVKNAFKFKFGTTDLAFSGDTTTVAVVAADVTATGSHANAGDVVFVKSAKLLVTYKTRCQTYITVDINKSVKVVAN